MMNENATTNGEVIYALAQQLYWNLKGGGAITQGSRSCRKFYGQLVTWSLKLD